MQFLRAVSSDLGRHRQHIRTLYDGVSSIRCPRDRGLDHAVARERRLKPLLNLKNFIISEPSKSIPLLIINQSKRILEIPFRPIEYIRLYPSAFEEFLPSANDLQPHIKLTPEIISLSSDEDLLYQSVSYKQDIAKRLLKLLMIGKVNKIPISLLELFKWELGLPQDYENVIIPEFPDYFRVVKGKNTGGNGKELELVCWSDEFAVSEMEKKRGKDGSIEFCSQYSNGFEMDPKYKKWVDEWQKLPYISPYEKPLNLSAKTDEVDKWAVSVLHEVLSIFVGKKVERESLLWLGEYLGIRSKFKVAFLQHPGIFYVSTKIGTHTVVLRDAYKRGMLTEKHALMSLRFKYAVLLNVVKDEEKSKSKKQKDSGDAKKNGVEESDGTESGEEDDVEMYDSSDDDESDDSEDEDESEDEVKRGKFKREAVNFDKRDSRNTGQRSSNGRSDQKNEYDNSKSFSTRRNVCCDPDVPRRSLQKNEYGNSTRFSTRRNVHGGPNVPRRSLQLKDGELPMNQGKFKKDFTNFGKVNSNRSAERRPYGRRTQENKNERFPRRTNIHNDPNAPRSTFKKVDDYENGDEGENGIKKGKFKRDFTKFGESNSKPSGARRDGRSFKKNENGNSTRFSERTDNRGDPSNPRSSPQKFDASRKRGERSRT